MQPHNINFNVLPRGNLVIVSVIIYSLNQFDNVNLKKKNQFLHSYILKEVSKKSICIHA